MRRDKPAYFMKNGAELPTRPVNILFDVVMLSKIFSAVITLWIHTGGASNGFRPHEFVEGPGAGELKLRLSESKGAEGDFSSRASFPSMRGRFLEVVYSNQSPRWRLARPCVWESEIGRPDDKRLRRLDRSLGLGTCRSNFRGNRDQLQYS
jgi:hypothetical protein